MHTPCPATGAAHATFELRESFPDSDIARLRFFAGREPANPLVARERRNVVPHSFRRRRLHQGLLPVTRHCMCRPTGELVRSHTVILSNPQGQNGIPREISNAMFDAIL